MALSDEQVEKRLTELMRVMADRRETMRLRYEELEIKTGLERTYIGQTFRSLRTPSLRSLLLLADALEMDIKLEPREGKDVPSWLLPIWK